ncbi:winged helix-turn-helix domain-containing protein [Piscinibacter gummiphilus]|uniref:Winged helix-turn-helix domain-containing protein n=1 Tax=Piscinibacter gummiphilus TaxID=946333 RepID=A0ABZ0D3A4_9BURK|nr:winged helix-turn-helix domain-containing protein [Piscinibacter gummiphilus]WOB09971.1 winged helix-turn-helix domain-containing protein [Piscinibacter gummiphilus]
MRFQDSDDFLLSANAYDFDLYVVELAQQGVRGIDLVRLIRRRSVAGIVALGGEEGSEFVQALESGADMVLKADAPADHLSAGVAAVWRRLQSTAAGAPGAAPNPWTLLESRGVLQAPDGTEITLSESDLAIVRCFADAEGAKVERRTLIERLWGPDAAPASTENALHATLYRLRKRIEQAGQAFVPVHAVARVGYEFRAPLVRGS